MKIRIMETPAGLYYLKQKVWFFWSKLCTNLRGSVHYFNSLPEAKSFAVNMIRLDANTRRRHDITHEELDYDSIPKKSSNETY